MSNKLRPVKIGRRAPIAPATPCLACKELVYPSVEQLDVSVFLDVVPAPRGGFFWFERHRCKARARRDDY
jgi:hypothetical protein